MRIAICFSGQIRTWDKCYSSWEYFFGLLRNLYGADVQIDIFVHTWNFNTLPPHQWPVDIFPNVNFLRKTFLHKQDKIDEFLNFINPVSYQVETDEISLSKKDELNKLSIQHTSDLCPIDWAASQLYSIYKSMRLKRSYEIEHGFQYDICVKLRSDALLENDDSHLIVENLKMNGIRSHSVYTMHSNNIDSFPFEVVGDVMFFSNSPTFDLLCSFWKGASYIPKSLFENGVLIEKVFAYYIKTLHIENIRIFYDVKVMREDNISEKIKQLRHENSSLL